METTGDKIKAMGFALAVHLLCILGLAMGVAWTHATRPEAAAGPIVEAVLVTADQLAQLQTRPRAAPPKPEPPKPEPPQKSDLPNLPPVPPKAEDKRNQEQIDRLALEKAEKAEREQELKRRKEQQVLEQEERLSKMERERMQQLEDIRKKREQAEKRSKLEQEKLAQLQDLARKPEVKAPPEPPRPPTSGGGGTSLELLARYRTAMQNAVTQNWLRPDSTRPGLRCRLRIVQIPGGNVISANVVPPCNGDDLTRSSLEAAVLRAQPLPYQGYESVFARDVNFDFSYDG